MNQYEMSSVDRHQLTWGFLLAQTYQLYAQRFWIFFRIGVPPALVVYLLGQGVRSFIRYLLLHGLLNLDQVSIDVWAVVIDFVSGALYWLVSTIYFAAIAVNVLEDAEHELKPWRSKTPFEFMTNAYYKVRQRFGSLLAVGCFTWILFFLGRAVISLAMFPLVSRLLARPGAYNHLAVLSLLFSVPILVFAGFLLSKLSLAVPELMDNFGMPVRESFRNSIRKTKGWESFFIFFVIKSGVAAYIIYWVVQRGLSELWNRTQMSESFYYWLASAVYIAIAAMVESPLFIAFSILYRESNITGQEAALTAEAIR